MTQWERMHWRGTDYLVVPNLDPNKSGCTDCAFEHEQLAGCPRVEAAPRGNTTSCLHYERRTGKEAQVIYDTPESVADYIARSLSS